MDKFSSYIPKMMSLIRNHIYFPNYISDKLVQIAGVMAWDLEYCIDETAYGSFHNYMSTRMELPFFLNTRMVRNTMDQAWMNLVIPTFGRFVIQGESENVFTVANLKDIDAQDFKHMLDNISVGAQVRWDDFEEMIEWGRAEYDHDYLLGSSMIN